ncbi:MAG: alpha-galactosidase [Clostridia bacterium]|nr:alpha-galactosidase [Clostridia bacterium]
MDIKNIAGKVFPKEFCPKCEIKKLINKTRISQRAKGDYDNGAALTPPMGWSSWNLFASHINESLIKEIADAMDKSGLAECGYKYVNIDDCWESVNRDADGRLMCNPITFPSGIKSLAGYVNSLGLKLGIYSSNGTLTCQNYPASLGHEKTDAETFASWGIEYFKYDFCHNEKISTYAPMICELSIGIANKGDIVVKKASDAVLTGSARIINDATELHGAYIAGLCSHNGTAAFNISDIPADGKYILTLVARTGRRKKEFAVIRINGIDEYYLYSPSSNPWEEKRNDQLTVELKKGENTVEIFNPIGSAMDSAAFQYKNMGRLLKQASKKQAEITGEEEKPIVFSICEWGKNFPCKWGREAGNLWRTTPDIAANWASIVSIYEMNIPLWKYACPGAWNDPDMLEVGNGKLTYEENRAHFSLWCMLAAPLILGNDIRTFVKPDGTPDKDNKVYGILTNREMIAIDQDRLGMQCRRIKTNGVLDVLVKPLDKGEAAICFFNKGLTAKNVEFDIKDAANEGRVNLPSTGTYSIKDIWEKNEIIKTSRIYCTVQPHGVKVYRIKAD